MTCSTPKIALRFDVEQKKVIGDVTHTLAILRDGTPKIAFDSVGLTIQSVTVNKAPAKFEATASKLVVPLLPRHTTATSSMWKFATKGNPRRTLFHPADKNYPTAPSRYGRKANPKTPATTCPPMTIRTTGSRRKRF